MTAPIRKILVAKLRHHGDVLLSSPLFTLLKKQYPDAAVHAYIYKDTYPMLAGHPAISRYFLYDKGWKKEGKLRQLRHEVSLLRAIRKERYDMVLNLTEGDRGALAAKISKAPIRIGFDPESSGMKGKRKCYTDIVRICHRERHTVERHLDVLRKLDIFPTEDERDLIFHISEGDRARATELLTAHHLSAGRFILVHPVSRWLFKCLPVKTIAALIRELQARGERVALSASPDPIEMAMCQDILELLPPDSVVNLAGQTNLKELGALIDMARCLITVDSVPLHLSSALKAPVVAIFGPTSDKTWAPWRNPNSRVVAKAMPCRPCYMAGCGGSLRSDCLETLDVREIVAAYESLALPSLKE